MRRTSQGDEPREPRAPPREARGDAAPRPSLATPLHWLLLTFLLFGVVLWTSIPTFADPGHTPVGVDGEAHAAPGETPEHCPWRPASGERGEVEVEDERDPESDDSHGLLNNFVGAEISTHSLAADRFHLLWRIDGSHALPLTGAGCIRGPPSRSVELMSI